MMLHIAKVVDLVRQTRGNTDLSVKPPATDYLLQDVLEMIARDELREAHQRLAKHFERGIRICAPAPYSN